MVLFIILGVVVLVALVVLGVLFYILNKEGGLKEENAVPLTDLKQLKKEFTSGLHEPQKPKTSAPSSPVSQAPAQMQSKEKELSLENEVYKKRAQELEEELRTISQKADGQSDEAKQMIETLTKENEMLKSQQADLEQAKQKLVKLHEEASDLNTENAGLQVQLGSANAKARLLEEEMAAVKVQMGEEISRANATVIELNREKEALLSAPKPDSDEGMSHELESLKYELIKARAQSSGLERVSFNYKNQLEDFFKKINAVQVSNDHLSQVKNRLEGALQEIKTQNEELAHKDQLAQFELEKNRSRLVNLEREYEDLKARMHQKDTQV